MRRFTEGLKQLQPFRHPNLLPRPGNRSSLLNHSKLKS